MNLSDRIELARKKKGWSRRILADKASAVPGAPANGISEDQVFKCESKRRVVRLSHSEPLIWLCLALGLPEGAELLRQVQEGAAPR